MKKLRLDELKVDSFVTKLSGNEGKNLKGGTTPACVASGVLIGVLYGEVKDALEEASETPTVTGSTIVDHSPCPVTPMQTQAGAGTCAHAHCHCETD